MMLAKFKLAAEAIMVFTIALGLPAGAQQQQPRISTSTHVVLIARMQETLSFGVNAGRPPESFPGPEPQAAPKTATTISTSWVLARGRDRVVIFARVKRPDSPVLIAFANPLELPGYGERAADNFPGFHLLRQPRDIVSQLGSLTITRTNVSASSAICLSDFMSPEQTPEPPENDYRGVMKIQVQALP